MRPGGKGLTNPNRCAEAVYRHVVRFGGPRIARPQPPARRAGSGTSRSRPRTGRCTPRPSPGRRAGPDVEPPAEEVRAVRELAAEPDVHEALGRPRRRPPGGERGPRGGLRAGADGPGGDDRAPGRPGLGGRGGLARRRRRPAPAGGPRRAGAPGGRGARSRRCGPGCARAGSGGGTGRPTPSSTRCWRASRRCGPRRWTAAAPRRRRSRRPGRWPSCSTATASRSARSS